MDAQISRRVRAQLMGEEEVPEPAPLPPQRRPDEGRGGPKGPRRPRNPWYLPPSTWYSSKAAKDVSDGNSGSFPYDSQILGEGSSGLPPSDEADPGGDGPHRLTQREKETLQIVEAYKQHMKGSRLPHFLQ